MENYYNDLNLPAPSPVSEVKKAYRELAKKYHPDKNLKNNKPVQNFLKVNRAYEFLKDADRKEKYDDKLARYKKKAKIHHDPVLIKEYIKKRPAYKHQIIFSLKIRKGNLQCEKCEGYGQLLNRFSLPATCPQCGGTGEKYT